MKCFPVSGRGRNRSSTNNRHTKACICLKTLPRHHRPKAHLLPEIPFELILHSPLYYKCCRDPSLSASLNTRETRGVRTSAKGARDTERRTVHPLALSAIASFFCRVFTTRTSTICCKSSPRQGGRDTSHQEVESTHYVYAFFRARTRTKEKSPKSVT